MILVTGGTGAMGSVLVRMLAHQGKKVRVLCMPGDPFVARVKDTAADIRHADIADRAGLAAVCDGVDTVLHLAAVIISRDEAVFQKINVEGTRNIVDEAVKAKVGHFIYVSSASVTYPAPTPYSLSKRAAEEIVKNSGLDYTMLRPTLVYGEKGGQEFDLYLEYLKKFPAVPFIGSGAALKRPVYVEDVNAGLLAACGSKKTFGKIYNLSGGEAVSMIDFTRLCLRLMDMERKPVVRLPVWLCKMIAAMMKVVMRDPPLKWQVIAGIIQDANLDPADAMKDLGYAPKKVTEQLPRVFPRRNG
ncbi:MAG TPA: NAD-dependent epimerase/dehydratase family protein [Chitinivibrionales bacterium]|nr:NAD-dependent epimerase/dehydratase family protein [Chitinivibrionales bacterium]